jgi:hypothetical protein
MIFAARLIAAAAALLAAALCGLLALELGASPPKPSGLFAHHALSLSCAGQDCPLLEFGALAARAPLDPRAFAGRMEAALSAGDTALARAFAARVLERNKRDNIARYVLAVEALEAGDPDRYLALYLPQFEIDRSGEAVRLFAGVLAGYSRDPEYFTRLERLILETRPWWGEAYLRALAAEPGIAPETTRALYAEYPGAQPALLAELTRAGDWGTAYGLFSFWLTSGALAAEAPGLAVPFNPELLDVAAPAPFNWRLHSRAAEFLSGGGVYVFFEGRRAETFLSQTFPLADGAWRLRLRMSGEARQTGGTWRWRLACADGTGTPEVFDIAGLGAAPAETVFSFERGPGACAFVTLSLVGVPGMFPQPARMEIGDVALERALPAEVAE